ncbi:uncharacterized protein LOC143593334 [Bidens hawaiensis]|uniref:uncharacterized protein LOC143593334 n=1 Tax=Bidens hawaiensis TaxID=980011 RepID=UPI0040499B2E
MNPLKFDGSEGATALLERYQSMESTFLHIECPEDKTTRFASSVFGKRALTWWVQEKSTRGAEVAKALPWEELKGIMNEDFCPPNELMNLEVEFFNLKQVGSDKVTYTARLNELSILVPHLVTPLSRGISKYIQGLPRQIQDSVKAVLPKLFARRLSLLHPCLTTTLRREPSKATRRL